MDFSDATADEIRDVYKHVPSALKNIDNWVLWKMECDANSNIIKVPYNPNNHRYYASHSNDKTWASFDKCCNLLPYTNGMRLGFVFSGEHNYFGIDVDDISKVAPENMEAALNLRNMIHANFNTYCELSPSKKGVHYYGIGSLPDGIQAIKDSKYKIEIYDNQRYFTVTGDVIPTHAHMADCTEILAELCRTLAPVAVAGVDYVNETDSRDLGDIITAITNWQNGKQFAFLMTAPLSDILAKYNNDHSSADLALTNFIAYGTKDEQKAIDIFRQSPLWRGVKGGYTTEELYVNKYLIGIGFSRVWAERAVADRQRDQAIEHGRQIVEHMMIQQKKSEEANKYALQLPCVNWQDKGVALPPFMLGEFVKCVHDAMFTPNLPYALATSLAFLSGICGRGYRYGRSGCNVFTLVAGKSSTGKTQSIDALEHLLNGIDDLDMSIKTPSQRIITRTAKTAQGIHDCFSETLAGAWITDECASMMRTLTDPVTNSDHELKDAINRLYDAAVPSKMWQLSASRASSDKKGINCLSMGVAWFTTTEKMYECINEEEAKDGFLSRFIPVFYEGVLGDDNNNRLETFPEHVKQTVRTLLAMVAKFDSVLAVDAKGAGQLVTVGIMQDAADTLDEFSRGSRDVARRAQNDKDELPEVYVALSRIGATATRLATVCSILDNPVSPVINNTHVQWAIQFVSSRTLDVIDRMETGVIGSGDKIECKTIIRVMKRLAVKKRPLIDKIGAVPCGELHNSLRLLTPFKNAKGTGAPMRSVKFALDMMVQDQLIERLEVETGGAGRNPLCYMINENKVWR